MFTPQISAFAHDQGIGLFRLMEDGTLLLGTTTVDGWKWEKIPFPDPAFVTTRELAPMPDPNKPIPF